MTTLKSNQIVDVALKMYFLNLFIHEKK